MSKKILTAVFAVLFVVLMGEVGYLFYSSRQSVVKNEPVPAAITAQPERQGTQAIQDNVLNYLSFANLGVLKSSNLTNHYEGKIIELSNKIDDASSNYALKIRFQGENGSINGFFYNKDEATQKLSIFRSVKDAPPEKITINDLKLGNLISVDEDLNLLNDDLNNFIVGIKITVLP